MICARFKAQSRTRHAEAHSISCLQKSPTGSRGISCSSRFRAKTAATIGFRRARDLTSVTCFKQQHGVLSVGGANRS
jgi:hypothetical protein